MLDRRQHQLLAAGAVEVVLGGIALVHAHARQAESVVPVEVVGAGVEVQRGATGTVAAVQLRAQDDRVGATIHASGEPWQVDVHAAQRVDELGEVHEVHLDHVVDVLMKEAK